MKTIKNIRRITFDTIDSTQLWTKKNAEFLNEDELTCVTAEEQTAGVGRFKRAWISPKGQNIYATLYFTLKKPAPFLAQLAQLLSLSCATLLKNKGFQPQIKWPNDILLAEKKVAGILCEILHLKESYGVVLGIGININMEESFLNKIEKPATSLLQISGRKWELEEVLTPLLLQFLKDLEQLQKEGFHPFLETYNKLLAFKGETITCQLHPKCDLEKIKGQCQGIDKEGRLELLLPSGEVAKLTSHECN